MDNTKKAVFIHSQELEKYSYPPDSMFVTQRSAKTRELLISLNLLGGGKMWKGICACTRNNIGAEKFSLGQIPGSIATGFRWGNYARS